MKIELTPEQERIVIDQVKSGQFRNAEEVIANALQALKERAQSASATTSDGKQAEAVRDMLAFVEKNRVRLNGITVKQLIHEGHRL